VYIHAERYMCICTALITYITTLYYKNKNVDSKLTLESGDPMMHQDVYSQYVFQEPSKVCRLSEPVNIFEDKNSSLKNK
jgi:hypothetical protein